MVLHDSSQNYKIRYFAANRPSVYISVLLLLLVYRTPFAVKVATTAAFVLQKAQKI